MQNIFVLHFKNPFQQANHLFDKIDRIALFAYLAY